MSVISHHSLQTIGWHEIKNLKDSICFDVSAPDSLNALNNNQTERDIIRLRIISEAEDSYWKRKRPKFSLFLCERIVSRDTILKFINSKTLLVLSKQSQWHLKFFLKSLKESRYNLAKQQNLYQCYDNVRGCPNISRTTIVSTNNFPRIWCFGLLSDSYIFY